MIFMLLSSIPSLSLMISLVVKQSNVNILFLEFWFIFKNVFPLYIFHFMCMNFSWWSFCIFFYISCAFLKITLYHIMVFSFLQLSLQFLFVRKTEMLITFVGVFESWTFRQSQSQNPNLNWTKIIIILDYYPTLGTRLLPQKWFFLPNIQILLWISVIRKNDHNSWLYDFIQLISPKCKEAILKSDYFVKKFLLRE